MSTTAASVSASRRVNSATPSVPGSTDSTSSPATSGVAVAAAAALIDVTPGTMTASNRRVSRVCRCMYEL
ncbi:hypothetical protein C1Y40_05857 [Mycobacterium talmoniae]|uniref:Uncharacterized protein n=1 Tax=Mycobacterium talmoniae TaxID=1858794 RepID=A0A2S8BBF5_9MYCO|nr:hypothetical protein C1Y40_05857 [Mycobacterium talmoniae]